MIEIPELQAKIAESKAEEIWTKVKDTREQSIKSLEESLFVEREVLKLAESKLEQLNEQEE